MSQAPARTRTRARGGAMATRASASPVGHERHALARPRRATRAAAAARPGWRATTVASSRGEPSSSSPSPSRRAALISALAGAAFAARDLASARVALAGERPVDMKALVRAFDEAMSAGSDFAKADEAWTRAIAIAPTNAAAWSNRGTKRLQAGRWADARDDLERSVELSPDPDAPDPLTLNNLGNAEGALGRWDAAMANYLEASKDREMESIALANFALAKFQVGEVEDALKATRRILRRDPEFWDMRAAQAAFLWAAGDEAQAETEWSSLCRSGRGFGAAASAEAMRGDDGGVTPAYAKELLEQQIRQQAAVVAGVVAMDGARKDGRESGSRSYADDTPCALYADVKIVAPRWPPRCTAALDAFLGVRRTGKAMDYDGEVKEYAFGG